MDFSSPKKPSMTFEELLAYLQSQKYISVGIKGTTNDYYNNLKSLIEQKSDISEKYRKNDFCILFIMILVSGITNIVMLSYILYYLNLS